MSEPGFAANPHPLSEFDLHLINHGNHERLFEVLGCHLFDQGARFAVWAPNAQAVSVIGDFNGWAIGTTPLRKHDTCGVWEGFVPDLGENECYKYAVTGANGAVVEKSDPLGFASELRPNTASVSTSVVRDLPQPDYERRMAYDAPMSIYEVHLGSWRKHEGWRFYSYDDLAEQLVDYVADLGFTHIEVMPLHEFPFDGSWGYQPTGLFCATSRFGNAGGLAHLARRAHERGLGVLMDWVPGHFPKDAHGLAQFDGGALYEYADPKKGEHPDWGTLVYDYGRWEVINFLEANAAFWLEKIGMDGLRVDAVASMLYLDYSREDGQWVPNVHGGNENLETIEFLKRLNANLYRRYPHAAVIAEESTAWPGVSRPVDQGGLGFGYKWNMGWMNDTLAYMSRDPIHRQYHHREITFGFDYAFDENFILPLSHDEVVHGKGSLLGRMPGDDWQRFANLRAYYGFMWGHPGKKLLFMGCEFGQASEWNHEGELPWDEAAREPNRQVSALVRELNALHRTEPALHQQDCQPGGLQWIEGGDAENSVVAFIRWDSAGTAPVAVITNFTPTVQDYRVGMPRAGTWTCILNTDSLAYGGSGVSETTPATMTTQASAWHGQEQSLTLTLPPLATLYLRLEF